MSGVATPASSCSNQVLRKSTLVALGAIVLLTFVARWPDLRMPLERDEGEYAYAAQEIARGYVPYRDSFCQKPPVVFFWYLAGFQLFGETVEGIHLTLVVAAALGAIGLYFLAGYFLGREAGLLAGAVFALSSAGYGYFGSAANTEMFMLVPVIFGSYFFIRAGESGGRLNWFVGGAFAALAFLTKQVALFSFLAPCGYAAWLAYRRGGWWEIWIGSARTAIGALLATLPIVLWLEWRQALGPLLEATLFHNLDYVGSPFAPAKWRQLFRVVTERFLISDGVLWLSALAGAGLFGFKRFRIPALVFAILWFAGSLLGVALGPFSFGHYFLQLLPPLVMLGSVAWSLSRGYVEVRISRGATGQKPGNLPKLVPIFLAALLLAPPVFARFGMLARPVEERCAELYGVYGPVPFAIAPQVAQRLKETVNPADKLLVVGSEPEILFYTRRRSATRYTIFYPLTGDFRDAGRRITEMLSECAANPPAKIIVCYSPSSFIGFSPTNEKLNRIYGTVAAIVRDKYREEFTVWMDLYTGQCQIREPEPDTPASERGYRLLQVFRKS